MSNLISRLNINEILPNSTTPHADCWQIICVSEGNICITLGNNVYTLNSNSVAVCTPKDYCSISKTENSNYIIFSFLANDGILEEYESKAVNISDSEASILQQLSILSEDLSNALKYQEFCVLLELLLLRCYAKQPLPAENNDKDAIIFNTATDILMQNIQNQISVSELSEKLGVSLSHLKRIFAKFAKIGVHEYFTYLKITEAKRLLKDGETVTDTAKITGFANQAYFSAAFKRITGISPKEFSVTKKKPISNPKKSKVNNAKAANLPDYLL